MGEEKPKLVKVQVKVMDRSAQGFAGCWAIQRFFANGSHAYVIPESKLEELRSEPMLAVESASPAPPDAAEGALEEAGKPTPGNVTVIDRTRVDEDEVPKSKSRFSK